MNSSKIWFAGFALAVPLATWAGGGCGVFGGGGSGGAGGAGGDSTASSGTTTSSTTTSSVTTSSATTSSTTSSSTGTGGTGGGTGGGVPANEKCPGEPHTLNLGDTLNINGTTAGAIDDFNSFCGDTTTAVDSPDVVYAITLTAEGNLTLTLTSPATSALVPSLDFRKDCSMLSDLCSSDGTKVQVLKEDLMPGTYFVIVDGQNGTSGPFSLSATLAAAKCGDTVVDTGEDCDPGAGVAGDGCGDPGAADECKFQAVPTGQDKCPGQAIAVPGGTTMLSIAQGTSTYGYSDDYVGSCSAYVGGRDRVFQLTPAKSGVMTVSVGYETDGVTSSCAADIYAPKCWAHMLYARTTCATASTEITGSCKEDPVDPTAPSTMTLNVTAGTPVFAFVDGYDDQYYSYGPFNLIVNLQ